MQRNYQSYNLFFHQFNINYVDVVLRTIDEKVGKEGVPVEPPASNLLRSAGGLQQGILIGASRSVGFAPNPSARGVH